MSRAVITWHGGREVIEGAKLGDPRVSKHLKELEEMKVRGVSLVFEDEFDIGRYIDDEEVYD